MKCIYCGAWSEVLETRDARRRRECANGHKFNTTEAADPEQLRYRNKQMVKRVLAGERMSVVAKEFGLRTHSELSRLMARAVPGFDGRSHGQQVRRRSQDERR